MSRGESERFRELDSCRHTMFYEYWYEKDHWPGLGCSIGRIARGLFVKSGGPARDPSTVTKRPWTRRGLSALRDAGGFALIVSSFIAGAWIADSFRLPVPGGVLGMVVVLFLIWLAVIPVQFVRRASAGLLYCLPVFFVPLYVEPFSNSAFWFQYGLSLLPLVAIGAAALLFLAHLFASRNLQQ